MNYLPDKKGIKILVTCEHGGNRVPARYRELFKGRDRLLNSHRGHDRHALSTAKSMAEKLSARLFFSTVTRLLVDLNRSPRHPKLFSEISGLLGEDDKKHVLEKYYLPYREKVESSVLSSVSKGRIALHISVHSFAPVMKGLKKNADIGLLYDPSRHREKALCEQWLKSLKKTAPGLRVRRNYPYLGKSDGLVTWLRRRFPPDLYVGIELELNQRIMKAQEIQENIFFHPLVSGLHSEI